MTSHGRERRCDRDRGQRGSSERTPRDPHRLEAEIVIREPVLVRLLALEETILPGAVLESGPNRVGEQHETDRVSVPCGVSPRLVIRLHAAETEPVPG